jgi:flagellar hook-basal body complex protein FliE
MDIISPATLPVPLPPRFERAAEAPGVSFGDQLEEAVQWVNRQQLEADSAVSAMASGEDVDLHGTMIALEEANISLRTMVAARDKVVEAYQLLLNLNI